MPPGSSHPYTLQLPLFEGPLDLLLRLIEQEKLEITAISLTTVTDQYLASVRAMTDPDPATMAEFLALAAQLVLIKSRALLPRPPSPPAPADEDTAEHLAQRLRDYQHFKRLAEQLRSIEATGQRTWSRSAPAPVPASAPAVLLPHDIHSLITAINRRLQLLQHSPASIVPLPQPKALTIAEVAQHLQHTLTLQPWVSFVDLLNVSTSRTEVIVCLWTVLELFKREVITIDQERIFDQISLGRGARFGAAWGMEDAIVGETLADEGD